MGQVWLIASAHGGEGKTVVTAQLGRALARRGYSVALVDLNIGFGDLDMALALQDSVIYNLLDAASGLCRLSQALLRDPAHEEMYLLGSPANEVEGAFTEDGLAHVLASLKERFDYVLMDAPPNGSEVFRYAAGFADRAVLLCAQGRTLRGARHLLGRLFQEGAGRAGVALNMVDKKRGGAFELSASQLDADILCAIPRDLIVSARYGELGNAATAEIDRLAGVLLEEEVPRAAVHPVRANYVRRFQDWLDGAE